MASLQQRLATRIEQKLYGQLNWTRLAGAVQGLSAQEKARIVLAVEAGNGEGIGRAILSAVATSVRADALTQAAAMLADGSLSEAELEQVL